MVWTIPCYWDREEIDFSELIGKTITEITGAEEGSKEIKIVCSDGSHYVLYHEQDCCEDVRVNDVCGEVTALIGSPILKAEMRSNQQEETGWGSQTWTFYQLATIKGYVDIRWYGESNGYYSEEVSFIKMQQESEE